MNATAFHTRGQVARAAGYIHNKILRLTAPAPEVVE